MKYLRVFNSKSFFLIQLLCEKQNKAFAIVLVFLVIIDLKMRSNKFFGLSNLFRSKTLFVYKLAEIIITNQNKNLVFTTFQVIAPRFENFNNN